MLHVASPKLPLPLPGVAPFGGGSVRRVAVSLAVARSLKRLTRLAGDLRLL